MNVSRKIRHNSQTSKTKKPRNSCKKQHLLSKPNTRKFSLSKFTNSFSTLASHTVSKINHHQSKHDKVKQRRQLQQDHNTKNLQSQIAQLSKTLSQQLKVMDMCLYKQKQNSNMETRWFHVVEDLSKQVKHEQLKSVLSCIQAGYRKFEVGKDIGIQKKKSKLSLDFGKIDRHNMLDYHDQFMSKIEQFSPSWREMLKLEKKSSM